MISQQCTPKLPTTVPGYLPMPYEGEWGAGAHILPHLSPLATEMWHILLPGQDKRNDRGHTEFVTTATYRLATALSLPPQDTEVAILAAIFHDRGYGEIPDINNRFRHAQALIQKGGAEGEEGQRIDRELRITHQELAKSLVEKHLGSRGYGGWHEVAKIVADHDTRDAPTTQAGQVMRDGDWLWRVSEIGVQAYHADFSPLRLYEYLSASIAKCGADTQRGFQTSIGLAVTRFEFARTFLRRFGEREIPPQMRSEYGAELQILL